ncbi:nucleotide exchange factor GrpE [Liquorilactobacillus sicerae]|uniref:nucleotide exchange factor GrpE n=1 Tax=Liquorilactobacillus sicerae TaxID=1416943 RepID=UPI002480C41A|nr:nucleotide exchange factor GrpE [Liquorilactobacillus sicerae]
MSEKESHLSQKQENAKKETDANKQKSVKEQTAKKADKETKTSKVKPAKKVVDQELKQQLKDLQAKYDQLEDKYLRAEAEMANMTTRFKNEQAKLIKYDGQALAKDVLPVLDNLARALQIEAEDDVSKQLKHGVEMVHRDMEKALKDNHITKIEALGQPFDPLYHQAVKTVPVEKDQKSETVVEVFQDGYLLKDRVLRPAMVVVAQ